MQIYNTDELTFFTTYSITLNGAKIPMICRIQDIQNGNGYERIPFFLNDENNIDYAKDDFRLYYQIAETEKVKITYFENFLDYRTKLFFDEESSELVNFLEYYGFENVYDFINILDDSDILRFKNQADKMIRFCINEFTYRAKKILGCDIDLPPIITTKDKPDHIWTQICEYLAKTKGYLETQLITEYPNNIMFEENIGKSFDNFSFREIQYKLLFLHKKESGDGAIEQYKAKKQEEAMRSTKSDSSSGVKTRSKRR